MPSVNPEISAAKRTSTWPTFMAFSKQKRTLAAPFSREASARPSASLTLVPVPYSVSFLSLRFCLYPYPFPIELAEGLNMLQYEVSYFTQDTSIAPCCINLRQRSIDLQ